MANRIKGITIEIGGNTTKLESALKDVNKVVYETNKELKDLNQALKLDPKNTELLAQKQDVLRKNIEATTNRLKTLKEAQRQLGDYNNLTDEQKENYRALSVEIAKSENALKNLNKELKNTDKADFTGLKNGLKKVGEIAVDVAKEIAKVTAALGAAITGAVALSLKEFADYEQQLGGIESLFKNSVNSEENLNKVLNKSKTAWKDLTISQTDYFRTFTATYPLVKNSIDDENKAIDTTNRMLQLESDLANTFGYDMETAANAINWALKGSYNYVDNLNLGIKGTKEGFLEAARESGYLVESVDDLTSDQILDVLENYANKYGVIGKTAAEASKTITGSAKAMKAAWKNFFVVYGSSEDIENNIKNVTEATMNFLDYLTDVILETMPSLVTGLFSIINDLLPKIGELVMEIAPILAEEAVEILENVSKAVAKDIEPLMKMVINILKNIVKFITDNIRIITEAAIQIVVQLANGIAEALPELIPAIVDAILIIVDTLIDNIDLIIDAAFKLMEGLAKGLINAIPILVDKVPIIILKLTDKLLEKGGEFLDTGIKFVGKIGEGLLVGIFQAINAVAEFVKGLVDGFLSKLGEFFDIGVKLAKEVARGIASVPLTIGGKIVEVGADIVGGIGNGMASAAGAIGGAVKDVGGAIVNGFKGFFGIGSPSKLMKDEVGKWIGIGLGDGIVEGIEDTEQEVNEAMSQLSSGIETSVNPTINPTANSNPLIIQIENFNNQRESDVQQLAQELEFYRKNTALAKGGK